MTGGDAVRELAAFLTGSEARQLADRLEAGETLTRSLVVVGSGRRMQVRQLMTPLLPAGAAPSLTVAVLRAVEGAHEHRTAVDPVWTAPKNLAGAGQLTSSIRHFVIQARESVMCSTFNFQRSSALWAALRDVSRRPELDVRIYVDTTAADHRPTQWSPTTDAMATELAGATILRTAPLDGRPVRNHAKFIAIDHQYLVVTSANFSRSAEEFNVELGLVLTDPLVTRAVERQMEELGSHIYEVVQRT